MPRSKRLRMEGTTGGSGDSAMVTVGGSSQSEESSHSHTNLADLDKLSVEDGYLMIDQTVEDVPQQSKVKAGFADEAAHASEADDATHAHEADDAMHAAEAEDSNQWAGHNWQDWIDQPIRSIDAVRFQSVTCSDLHSVQTFVDGLLGSGYRLWSDDEGITHLSIDKLTVRQTMSVMELLVEKIRSIGGALVVSAANGRISQVTERTNSFLIAFEQDNNFVIGDLIRCSVTSGQAIKHYWVEVTDVTEEGIVVDKASFPNNTVPAEGDECVLMGNTLNPSRQNLVMISATEDGQPRIDVLNGVHSTSLDGCLRARLGNLDGITDNWFAPEDQPHGDGLYSDNVYLKGKFLLENGDNVKTRFEATEGLIASMVEGLRQDMLEDKGYLNNATFGSGMDMWKTSNEAVFYMLGNKWIWANNNVLTKLGNCAVVVNDHGRTVVHIRNNYIRQKNSDLRNTPTIQTLGNGMKEPVAVYLSFYYRCASPGTLSVTFENVDTTGFETFTSLNVTQQLAATQGYEQFTCSGLWNGTGDFKLTFTGDIYLYMLCLSLDKTEALAYRYRTLFEQTANLVKICAAVYDKNAQALSETGLFIKPTGAGIYVQNADGSVTCIGAFDNGTIKLQASNIKLEGLVTAGGNFKILNDGSMEAKNGTFDGYLKTTFKNLSESDAVHGTADSSWSSCNDEWVKAALSAEGCYTPVNDLNLTADGWVSNTRIIQTGNGKYYPVDTIVLPTSPDYIGRHMTIFNSGRWGGMSRSALAVLTMGFTQIICRTFDISTSDIFGANATTAIPTDPDLLEPEKGARAVRWWGGTVELVGIPDGYRLDEQGNRVPSSCAWALLNVRASYVNYIYEQ